jgi:N-acetylmuramoyl-L-alanine amidase
MIGICIGHSRWATSTTRDGGALSVGGVNEWTFNRRVGKELHQILNRRRIPSVLIDLYEATGYGAAMRWLAAELRRHNATLAIELHFNAGPPLANGHEWLHWHTSSEGKRAAQAFHDTFQKAYPSRKSRGLKRITPTDRGGEFLSLTHCPAVILEPFFGSNKTEWNFHATRPAAELPTLYADAIEAWLKAPAPTS